MGDANETGHDRWARLRFSVVGPLLAAPPAPRELAPELGTLPSYATLRRWMKAHGLLKKRQRPRPPTEGEALADVRLSEFETRSFEVEYVNALWVRLLWNEHPDVAEVSC